MWEYDSPLTSAPRYKIRLQKLRANGDLPDYQVADNGHSSVPALIRNLLELTAPLVKIAPTKLRSYAFLCVDIHREIRILVSSFRVDCLKHYLEANRLPHMRFSGLRDTTIINDFLDHGDIERSQQFARHKSKYSTYRYLEHLLAYEEEHRIIADAQSSIHKQRRSKSNDLTSRAHETGRMAAISHECLKPFNTSFGSDNNGFCLHLLWPLNDRHFVMRLVPESVAFLLREYRALCDAQKELPAKRFAAYLPKKNLIEQRYLTGLDEELVAKANEILAALPSIPRID